MQKARLTINLDPMYLKGLKILAKRENRTVSDYLRLRITALVDADPSIFSPTVHEKVMLNHQNGHAEVAR